MKQLRALNKVQMLSRVHQVSNKPGSSHLCGGRQPMGEERHQRENHELHGKHSTQRGAHAHQRCAL